jgi:hypothetical protein
MRYTPQQYYNMISHIETSIADAESHNGRIIKHLDEGDPTMVMHRDLQEMLIKTLGIAEGIMEWADGPAEESYQNMLKTSILPYGVR